MHEGIGFVHGLTDDSRPAADVNKHEWPAVVELQSHAAGQEALARRQGEVHDVAGLLGVRSLADAHDSGVEAGEARYGHLGAVQEGALEVLRRSAERLVEGGGCHRLGESAEQRRGARVVPGLELRIAVRCPLPVQGS